MMPPPGGVSTRHKRRHKRALDSDITKESKSDTDSDSAFGFGSDWAN